MPPTFDHEIRFALVLYGGASLAVYIHGVTLEFFHLVRATAADADGRWMVGDAGLGGTERVYRTLASEVQARFLVDVASGTSAGGINAIFLGKALANGQSLDTLSKLWLDEADARVLLNRDWCPRSLLSSRTMLAKLESALAGMDRVNAAPLQPEMDVFVTATDIQGVELPIQLADKTVLEKRHKSVFHLRFGPDGNHFARGKNRFLALVARATSAFPFAFEPVRVEDRGPFIDGGFLDNKPFSHAVAALSWRASDVPATRKLIYIEPSPESATKSNTGVLAGPRLLLDQSIREDLGRVLDRNNLIERVREITSNVDADVAGWNGGRTGAEEYQRRTLAQEIHDRGPGYAGYHRLKVRAVTDAIAAMLGVPPDRMHGWRRSTYSEQDPLNSESRFLLEFDLGYRQRRLRFLLSKVRDADTRRELARILATLKPPAVASSPAAISEQLRPIFIRAAADVEACLDAEARRIFDQFEYYDQIMFPVFYEASVGEPETCEVFRISPRDATSILDENAPGEKRRKLAGTALFNFGAFLSREWRENDLLWGRLDGAERIIRSVLPRDSERARALIDEANIAIAGGWECCGSSRRLPLLTGLSLGFRASRILLKMLVGYFIRMCQ